MSRRKATKASPRRHFTPDEKAASPWVTAIWSALALVNGQPTLLDAGMIRITSRSATRVQGTFSATPKPGTGSSANTDLVITNGTFDVGFP